MPDAHDHDRVAIVVDAISDDIGATTEWDDQFAITSLRSWTSAFREIAQRVCRAEQRIDSSLRQRFAVRLEKSSKPNEIGSRAP